MNSNWNYSLKTFTLYTLLFIAELLKLQTIHYMLITNLQQTSGTLLENESLSIEDASIPDNSKLLVEGWLFIDFIFLLNIYLIFILS